MKSNIELGYDKHHFGRAGSVAIAAGTETTGRFYSIHMLASCTFGTGRLVDELEKRNSPYGIRATGTITYSATGPANGQTINIGGTVYTYKTTPTAVTDIQRHDTPATVADNTMIAVNSNPNNTMVTATAAGDVTTIIAVDGGTAGNAIPLVRVGTVAGTTLSAGGVLGGVVAGAAQIKAEAQTFPANTVIYGDFRYIKPTADCRAYIWE